MSLHLERQACRASLRGTGTGGLPRGSGHCEPSPTSTAGNGDGQSREEWVSAADISGCRYLGGVTLGSPTDNKGHL